MKLFSKIRALFSFRGEPAELEVSSAEVKQGRVFLHPIHDKEHIYCVKSDAVDILISPHKDITEDDIDVIDVAKIKKESTKNPPNNDTSQNPVNDTKNKKQSSRTNTSHYERKPISTFMPKMRTFSITLYPDEYDELMDNIRSNGYKKTEFLLACVASAKKNSMDATYKRYTAEHKERRAADRYAARIAQEQEYQERRKQNEIEHPIVEQ